MSKLTDRLDALGRVSPAPMGFAARPRATASPTMLLIGSLKAGDAGKYADAEGVDAFVLTDGDTVAADAGPVAALDGKLWGVSVGDITFTGLDRLKDKGCDFVIPSSNDRSAAVLRDDDMARGYNVDLSLNEELARAIEFLPIDFLVLSPPADIWPLKLSGLIKLESAVSLVGRHFVLQLDAPLEPFELEVVRNLPVDALLVDLATTPRGALRKYRERIDALPPRKPRVGGGDRPDLAASHVGSMAGVYQNDDDDDDWDD